MNFRKRGHGYRIAVILAVAIIMNLVTIPVSAQTAPTVSDFSKTGLKNANIAFTADDFSAHFTDANTPALTLQRIRITQLPDVAAGNLKSGDTLLAENDEVAVENLGTLVFVPNTDWTGTATFSWKGSNGTDFSDNAAAVTITITEPPVVNESPIASDINISTPKNTPITSTLTATDAENNPLVYELVSQPSKGSLTLNDANTGSFTYTPNTNETGADSFQFRASDGNTVSNTATVNITITVPAPPPFVYADLVNHWANTSAGELAQRNIIVGEKIAGKYYFYPDKTMSRAEFNLFLNAALGIDSDTLGSDPVGYADESRIPIWALHEARAAYRADLIKGTKVGNKVYYRAYDKVTRLETLVILHNALKPTANNTDPIDYTDKKAIPNWAVQYVKNMKGYGIMKGYPDKSLHPNETITRAQAAEFLYQLVKYKEANPE